MRRFGKALVLGLGTAVTGALLYLTPLGIAFEERVGLDWLFRLRGPIEQPTEVAVVSLDRQSRDRLDLPERIRDWPRTVHADLIDRIAQAGAAVIVLDLIFDRPRERAPDEDRALTEAVARAGNVVLLEYLRAERRLLPGAKGDPAGLITTEQVVRPLPEFLDAAAGVGPFPLPKVSEGVRQFWAFKATAGGRPSLAVVALHLFAAPVWPTWFDLFERTIREPAPGPPADVADPGGAIALQEVMRWVRERFENDPELARRLAARIPAAAGDERARHLLDALTRAYGGADSRYLNFYGPPGQVRTVPAHAVLEARGALEEMEGRAVFVGLSETINLHEDGFTTVFSRQDGVDLSGVEVAATAFANLLDGRSVRPLALPQALLLLAAFGIAAGLLAGLLPALVAVPVVLLLGLVHVLGAQVLFARDDLWLPLAVPVLLQLPLGLFAGLLVQYRDAQRARTNIARGVRFYLPEAVATGLAEGEPDSGFPSELVYSTCLVSDAEHFTTVAEAMPPRELTAFLNAYFELLFGVIRRHGGIVTDVVGDGMTAVWTAPGPDRACRARACRAAVEVQSRLAEHAERARGPRLPTRIGLHSGWVVVGNIGGSGRLVYSVTGDIVNTAARIETLNKQLGTRLLATSAVTADLGDLVLRPLGRFRVVGKTEAIEIVEIVGRRDDAVDDDGLARFAEALACFQSERWRQASKAFSCILARNPCDGPARFYLHLLDQYLRSGAPDGDPTVVRLTLK